MKIKYDFKYIPRWKQFLAIAAIVLLIVIGIGLLPGVSVVGVPIFGFHGIYDSYPSNEKALQQKVFNIDYPKQDLEEFLDYLTRTNYWTLTAQELYGHFISNPRKPIPFQHWGQKPIALTFDDSYRSIYTHLLPILENLYSQYHRKIKVILFVNSGLLGKHKEFIEHISCEELRDGFRKGFFDIQSHTISHLNLTRLSREDLVYQLSEDQANLRRCIGNLDRNRTVALHIAYPFGADNNLVDQVAARYFLSGYLYNDAIFRLVQNLESKFGAEINNYRIPRLIVSQHESVKKLKSLAAGSARFESLFLHYNEHIFRLKDGADERTQFE